MKRIFIDTNVILDFLGERHSYYTPVTHQIATLLDKNKLRMILSPISFATVHYFFIKIRKRKPKVVIDKLRKFKVISEISIADEHIPEETFPPHHFLNDEDTSQKKLSFK